MSKIFKSIREEFAPYFRRAQKINSTEGRCSTVIVKEKYAEFLDKVISHKEIELQDKVLILLQFSLGNRISELVGQGEEDGIRVSQVDLVRMRVHGIKVLKKRGKKLLVEKPIYPNAKEVIAEYLKGKNGEEKVMPISRKAAARRIAKYFGFSDIHSTRHAWVTNALESGIDPLKISYMQGWSDGRMAYRYMNSDVENELEGMFTKKKAA